MNKTSPEILDLVLERIASELIDEPYRKKIKSLVEGLPVLKHGIIEMYSEPKLDRVDLMLCVQKKFNENNTFESYFNLIDDKFLIQLFKNWSDSSLLLASVLENIYIVYDIKDLDKKIIPWPYLAFSRLSLDPTVLLSIFKNVCVCLNGVWNNFIELNLLNCLTQASNNFHVFGFGLLQGRNKSGFRIGVSDFKSIAQVVDYLQRIEWNLDFQKFEEQLKFVDDYAKSYVLSLVIQKELTSQIGLECVLPKMDNKITAKNFLNRLDVDDAELIVEAISQEMGVNSWINHVKINFSKSNITSVKSYLYYELI